MNPMWRARHAASARSLRLLISVSPTRTDPRVGRSMPASRFNRVDLPDPDGPIRPRKSPSGTLIDTRSSTGTSIWSRLYNLLTSRNSMSATLGSLHPNDAAVGQAGRRTQNHRLARRDAAAYL